MKCYLGASTLLLVLLTACAAKRPTGWAGYSHLGDVASLASESAVEVLVSRSPETEGLGVRLFMVDGWCEVLESESWSAFDPGDLVLRAAGAQPRTLDDCVARLAEVATGDSVRVWRDGHRVDVHPVRRVYTPTSCSARRVDGPVGEVRVREGEPPIGALAVQCPPDQQ